MRNFSPFSLIACPGGVWRLQSRCPCLGTHRRGFPPNYRSRPREHHLRGRSEPLISSRAGFSSRAVSVPSSHPSQGTALQARTTEAGGPASRVKLCSAPCFYLRSTYTKSLPLHSYVHSSLRTREHSAALSACFDYGVSSGWAGLFSRRACWPAFSLPCPTQRGAYPKAPEGTHRPARRTHPDLMQQAEGGPERGYWLGRRRLEVAQP